MSLHDDLLGEVRGGDRGGRGGQGRRQGFSLLRPSGGAHRNGGGRLDSKISLVRPDIYFLRSSCQPAKGAKGRGGRSVSEGDG